MTTSPGSRPTGDGAWASRLTARPPAQPGAQRAARRASRRASARRAALPWGWGRVLHEDLAARFAVPPRAVLALVLLSVAVLAVLGFRLVLAGREVATSPVAPAVAGPPADAGAGTAAVARAGGPGAAGATGGPGAAGASSTGAAALGPLTQHGGAAGLGASPERGAGVAAATAPTAVDAGGAPGSCTGSGEVVVHVVGRVRHPGVVRLPVGARVQQAVAAAGGARRDADLARVNLARPLVDGEQVVVPRPGEPAGAIEAAAGALRVAPGGAPPGASLVGGGPGPGQLVDLNTATLAELDTLPGVCPVLDQRILDWRAPNGRFTAGGELGEVSGIGDAVLARVRPLVML